MKSYFMLFCLSLIVAPISYAAESDVALAKSKMDDMKTIDIPKYEQTIEKSLKSPVKFIVNWPSFSEVSYQGSQYLGSTMHSITGEILNNKQQGFVNAMKDVKVIKFDHHKAAEIIVKKGEAAEVLVQGDFDLYRWHKSKGFTTQLIRLNSK